MLSDCELTSAKGKGKRFKPTPINFLCNLWSKHECCILWNQAKGHAILTHLGAMLKNCSQLKKT